MPDLNGPSQLIYIFPTWPFLKSMYLICSQNTEGTFKEHSAWGWASCLELQGEEPYKETTMIQQDVGNTVHSLLGAAGRDLRDSTGM